MLYPLAKLIARVPLVVIGEPLTLNPVGTLRATLVTVPTEKVRFALKSNVVPFIVKVLLVGTAFIVDGVIASQIGAFALVPSPVDDRNILVVVILPALLVGMPIALL
jgi:hypothetical protein